MATLICPECHKPLRTAHAIPPGQKVKCPGCAAVFAAPASDHAEEQGIQAKPATRSRASRDENEEDERPSRNSKKKVAAGGSGKRYAMIGGGIAAALLAFAL